MISTYEGGILSGPAIKEAVAQGAIEISPYDLDHVNPNSFDLTLGPEVKVYKKCVRVLPSLGKVIDGRNLRPRDYYGDGLLNEADILDSAEDNETLDYTIQDRFCLLPGIGYLMHTNESVFSDYYVPVIDGKSSYGRLFVTAHVTAGYGETGFKGQVTLEVLATQPTWVYRDTRFCQVRFMTVVGEVEKYSGNYRGDAAKGAVRSRAWKQIAETRKKKGIK